MLRLRLLLLLATTSAALVIVIPTFRPTWEVPFLGNQHRVHLGTELRGGTDLWLEVGVEEGLSTEVRADVAYLRSRIDEGGLTGAEIRQVAGIGFEIDSEAETHDVVEFVDARLGSYRHDGFADGLHRFTLSERRQKIYRETATRRAVEEVRQRVADLCVDGATVERWGDDRIFVSLPGESVEANCR